MAALLIGYARCTTDQQDLTAQRDGLAALGVADNRVSAVVVVMLVIAVLLPFVRIGRHAAVGQADKPVMGAFAQAPMRSRHPTARVRACVRAKRHHPTGRRNHLRDACGLSDPLRQPELGVDALAEGDVVGRS